MAAKSVAVILFFLAIIGNYESFPFLNTFQDDFFLKSTTSSVGIYRKVDESRIETELSFEAFKINEPKDVSSNLKDFASEKTKSFNQNIVNELQKQCEDKKAKLLGAPLLNIDANFVIGNIGAFEYPTSAVKIDTPNLYNHYSYSDEYRWRSTAIETIKDLQDKIFILEKMDDYKSAAMKTIDDMFREKYDWKTFNEKFVIPNIGLTLHDIQNTVVGGCNNNSIIIHHTISTGSELDLFNIYELKVLGSIEEDLYVEPIMPSEFIDINGTWAVFNNDSCPTKNKCSPLTISFPQCNPSNPEKCEKLSVKVEKEFLKYYQSKDRIQFVTNLKTFTITPSTVVKIIYRVPNSGKVTVSLAENEILSIGNQTFSGKSKNKTKIIFHRIINESLEISQFSEVKMDENDSGGEGKNKWVIGGAIFAVIIVGIFVVCCFIRCINSF